MSRFKADDLVYEPPVENASRALVYGVVALLCLVAGIGIGLYYSWNVEPRIERNTRPDQLREEDRVNFVVAIALDYAHQNNLDRTFNLLLQVAPEVEPSQLAADTACELKRRGRVQTSADIAVVRHLIRIYSELQPGMQADCDLEIFATSAPVTVAAPSPVPTQPPTQPPVATKTATAAASQVEVSPSPVLSTPAPTSALQEFQAIQVVPQTCNPENSGVIEIYVREANSSDGIPGVEVNVTWNIPGGQGRDRLFTGLKPIRGDGYADFEMVAGETYRVSLPGRSDPTDPLVAEQCDEAGTIRSYQVVFQSQ
ncbi:MAG: hypothetical protein GYB66_02875 [Chloroflexi bacterium]|nr:hypothetical protein [Chloroflexota bacterium]